MKPEDRVYPDPAVVARNHRRQGADNLGLLRDELIEARIQARDYSYKLDRMQVELDDVADNLGLLPDEVQADVREAQLAIRELQEWVEEFARCLSRELDRAEN